MNLRRMKKGVAGAAVALALIFSCGIISTTAQAQSRDRYWQRDRDDYRGRDREWYRRQRERERARDAYRYGNRRNYPYYGNYGDYSRNNGYASSELQRGYRNGLKEGQDDARDRDSFNPNRHSSFRDGNPAYRQGFGRGYEEGYRQYARYRRW